MISSVEALNYRCLHYVSEPLDALHVLVGPNASGKTTFLDAIAFVGDLVSQGLDYAVNERTNNFHDLLWRRTGTFLEIALEATIPEERRQALPETTRTVIRYELRVGSAEGSDEVGIVEERVLLSDNPRSRAAEQPELFPASPTVPPTLLSPRAQRGSQTVVKKVAGGNDNFYDETGRGWDHAFKLGPRKSALANLPEDETKFPVTTWFKSLLSQGVQRLMLNSLLLRKASPPGQVRGFKTDGSNLPWVVRELRTRHPDRFHDWVKHVRTALPDVGDIDTTIREDDRHCYLRVQYENGVSVPSWMASDGTLRLFALTLPAYLPDFQGVYLIEEPENGIHPRAIETVFQSLSSVYDAQILLATHSPVILGTAPLQSVLCFARNDEGSTDITRGDQHPALRHWRGETSLGTLFAAGVLG